MFLEETETHSYIKRIFLSGLLYRFLRSSISWSYGTVSRLYFVSTFVSKKIYVWSVNINGNSRVHTEVITLCKLRCLLNVVNLESSSSVSFPDNLAVL